jgi:hypothetical protein
MPFVFWVKNGQRSTFAKPGNVLARSMEQSSSLQVVVWSIISTQKVWAKKAETIYEGSITTKVVTIQDVWIRIAETTLEGGREITGTIATGSDGEGRIVRRAVTIVNGMEGRWSIGRKVVTGTVKKVVV